MTKKQFVYIHTGEIVEAALVSPDGDRFWQSHQLKADGTPNRKLRHGYGHATRVRLNRGVETPSELHHYNGDYAPLIPAAERAGNQIRARIEQLEKDLHAANLALRQHYAAVSAD